jgi:hypothetical protein
MADIELNLNWLITNHKEFLQQFGIDQNRIIDNYAFWKQTNSDSSVIDYFVELLR